MFTTRLSGHRGQSYNDRLARYGIERLELRRIKQDLILTQKIYFGLAGISATVIAEADREWVRGTRAYDTSS